MRIFISGATGVLGHRLVERLSDDGHTVFGSTRDDAGSQLIEEHGGRPRRCDVLDRESLERAVPDVECIIHAATAIPTSMKPAAEEWKQNDRVRLDGARNLVDVAGDALDRFFFPSVVWVARQPDGSWFDESSPRNPDIATRSAAEVEEYLLDPEATHGFDATVLRCGFFYAPDGAYTRQIGQNLLSGKMPIIGRGLLGRNDSDLSMLHADDAARAFSAAIDADVSGLYHVVDEEWVTLAAYLSAFADQLGVSTPRRVPGWLARLFLGDSVDLLTKPMPTNSELFRSDTGWQPTYPTYREGLKQIVERWINDGTLRETPEGYEWTGE